MPAITARASAALPILDGFMTGLLSAKEAPRSPLVGGRRLAMGMVMTMVLMAEDRIRVLVLLVGHGVVKRLAGGHQLLQAVGMRRGDRLVGAEIIDSGHGPGVLAALLDHALHRLGVVAHRLRHRIPLLLLRRRDLELVMELLDARLDAVGVGRLRRLV